MDSIEINYDFGIIDDSVEIFSNNAVDYGFGSFQYNISQYGNSLYFTFDKKYNSREIKTDQFEEYHNFCEKLNKVTSQNKKFHDSF